MKINQAAQVDQYRKITLAIQKHLSSVASMTLAGTVYTPTQLVSLYQQLIAGADAATAARAAWLQTVKTYRTGQAQSQAVETAFKRFILSMFAGQDGALADFTFSDRKAVAVSATTMAVAVQKRAATRAARHTMGPRQKAQVKGVVTSPNPTPTAEPAVQAPTVVNGAGAPATPPKA